MDCSKSSYFEESKKDLFKDTFTCTIKVKKCVDCFPKTIKWRILLSAYKEY